jgi:hypothetical protein
MLVRVRDTGAVMYQQEFLKTFTNTSFPAQITEEVLNSLGADVVLNGAQPTPTFYQAVAQDGVEQVGSQWFTKFICVDMSQEAKNAKDADFKAANKATAENLLSATDWTQVADVFLLNKQAFVDYRAAIRAIALNPPVIVENWAVKPEEQWS